MAIVNYKKVKCPRCGKSYFKVKENNDFITLGFKFRLGPIYKNGELQNPAEIEPNKERCECLECGCNFRVEFIDFSGEYKFIDEDVEIEEVKKKLEDCSRILKAETSDVGSTTNGAVNPPKSATLKLSILQNQLTSPDIRPVVVKSSEEILKEELDEIKERLEKLEKKEKL